MSVLESGVHVMRKVAEPAAGYWEVDRRTGGDVLRPFCVVILRNKKKSGQSYVKASSTDFESMQAFAEEMRKDLCGLTNEEFIEKYKLGPGA